MTYCHRFWDAPTGGVYLCTLLAGHRSAYCIDQHHNTSHPTTDTRKRETP